MKKSPKNDLHTNYTAFLLAGLIATASLQMKALDTDELIRRFDRQRYEFPQEKAHVMTDRDFYMGGDTVWFRVFIVDAASHQPVKASKYAYVDLVAPSDSAEVRVKVKEQDGVYAGYLPLPQDIPEADYTLTAYTAFMESVGEPYFFRKNIRIGSPFSTKNTINADWKCSPENGGMEVTLTYTDNETGEPADFKQMTVVRPDGKTETSVSRKKTVTLSSDELPEGKCLLVAFDRHRKYILPPNLSQKDFDVAFFPEGGYLIPGKANKVGFKAISADGKGISVSCSVLDSQGNCMAEFSDLHSGIGVFTLFPNDGETYHAVCRNANGSEKTFDLPLADRNAAVLNVNISDSTVDISAVSANDLSGCRLLVHERGNLLLTKELDTGKTAFSFNKSSIPTGVVNAVLFDAAWNPLSERLFFVDNGTTAKATVTPTKKSYANREKVSLSVSIDNCEFPEGGYAVSVTDNKSVPPDSAVSIASTLLLSSEIRGGIENPEYYFSGSTDAKTALDALMLTQAWRRYDIPAVVAGRYSQPSSEIEIGQEVRGEIRSKWRNRPEKDALISLLVPKYGYANVFQADSTGTFRCNGFDFPENTTLFLSALNKEGKPMFPNFRIDNPTYPETGWINPKHAELEAAVSADNAWENFTEQEKMRYKYSGMEVMLEEVIVQGVRIKSPEDRFDYLSLRRFDYEEMEKEGITSVEEVLRKIAGLKISPDGFITYRRGTVSVYIDGIRQYVGADPHQETTTLSEFESQMDFIERIPFDFIKKINFLQPDQAALYGNMDNKGGIIMITTKKGNEFKDDKIKDYITITPLGYQQKAEFYAPKYDTPEAIGSTVPDLRPTLYWNPNVEISKDGKSEVSFYASDVPGTSYSVRIEGITDSGEIIEGSCTIEKK